MKHPDLPFVAATLGRDGAWTLQIDGCAPSATFRSSCLAFIAADDLITGNLAGSCREHLQAALEMAIASGNKRSQARICRLLAGIAATEIGAPSSLH